MKNLTKTLLTATLILGLPLGAYAASEAVSTAQPAVAATTAAPEGCPMDGSGMMGGKHHGGRHDKMARMQNMTPEQIQANLQQRYDRIEDPAKKAEFIKNLNDRAAGMTKHAEAMKQFAEANQ
jgi:Spy/CpxP family protein refolding chaperone